VANYRVCKRSPLGPSLSHLNPGHTLWFFFLAYFPHFEKTEKAYGITLLSVCVCVRPCVCLCVTLCIPPINFWTPESIFMKLGTYVTAPEPISTAWLKNPSHQWFRRWKMLRTNRTSPLCVHFTHFVQGTHKNWDAKQLMKVMQQSF
jgi:hypothetical protein